jgi:hypothetical protein
MSDSTTRIATMSTRGRPQANSAMAPASMPKTVNIGPACPSAKRGHPSRRNIAESIHKINSYGMFVNAGFILGFDSASFDRLVDGMLCRLF